MRQMLPALLGLVGGACSLGGEPSAASLGQTRYARSSVLWPVAGNEATVSVCWLMPEIGGETFPVKDLAPDLTKTLTERKAWARAAVEAAWNANTPVQFVGWGDCATKSASTILEHFVFANRR